MKVLSVNVGLPREVLWRGKPITTGIYKEPVAGRVRLRWLNLDGDRQADLRVHGGADKAVYAYPSEFYELWSRERPELDFGPGVFGENLTEHDRRAPLEAADLHDPPLWWALLGGGVQGLALGSASSNRRRRRPPATPRRSCAASRVHRQPEHDHPEQPGICNTRSLANTSSGAAPRPVPSTSVAQEGRQDRHDRSS